MTLNGETIRIEQLRSWQRSSIVRVTAGERVFFLKAVPEVFAHEVPLSQWLADHFPEHVPSVHATHPERGWMLLDQAAGAPLDEHPDRASWADALREYAELQIATVKHADQLLAMGLPQRSAAWLMHGLDALLADEAVFLIDQPGGFSHKELLQLRSKAGEIRQRCEHLALCGIPVALEHGDFGQWQILAHQSRFTYLDWSDAGIANPLFSLASFLIDLPESLATPAASQQLVDAYLEPWARLVPRADLEQAWTLSTELVGLYGALIYHREILPNMELRWEMERMLPFIARMLL
jgi:hypothetical protein